MILTAFLAQTGNPVLLSCGFPIKSYKPGMTIFNGPLCKKDNHLNISVKFSQKVTLHFYSTQIDWYIHFNFVEKSFHFF